MKTRFLVACICLFVMSGIVFAQDVRPKIAVIGLTNPSTLRKSNLGNALVDMLDTEISQSGKFRLIERDALQQVLNEVHLGSGDDFDAKEIVKKGGLVGTDFLILGKISNYTYRETASQSSEYHYPQGDVQVLHYAHIGEVRLDLRIVDVKTGEAVRSVVGHGVSQNSGQVSFQTEWNGYLSLEGAGGLSSLSTLLTEAATIAIHDAVRNVNDMHSDLVAFLSGRAIESDLSSISEGRIEAVVGPENFVLGLRDTGGLRVGDRYRVNSETIIRDSTGKEVYRQKKAGSTLEVVDVSQKDRAMARLLPTEGATAAPTPREMDSVTLDTDYAKTLRGMSTLAAGPNSSPVGGNIGGTPQATDAASRIQSFLAKGDRYLSNENYSEALQQFKSGLQLSPANPDLLSREVVALAGVDNFTDAEEVAEKAINLGGSIHFPVIHNLAFGYREGDFVIQKGKVSYQPKSGDDGFTLSSGGLIDITPSMIGLPELVIRWRAADGKMRKYDMVFSSYLTRTPADSRIISRVFQANGDAFDKTTRLDKMITNLVQENSK
jgi:curli biogenesis system outer membrane secretion channel CsgG